jgi:hypothetical protein
MSSTETVAMIVGPMPQGYFDKAGKKKSSAQKSITCTPDAIVLSHAQTKIVSATTAY